MTTSIYKSDGSMRAQDAPARQPEAASEAQQRFKQLLAELKGRSQRAKTAEEDAATERPDCPPGAPAFPLPVHPGQIGAAELHRAEGARSVTGVSAPGNALQADISAVLHALTEAVCSPAAPADSQPTVNSESVSLRVEVLSGGPLTGAQMIVAASQGKVKMTVRVANHEQRTALESIRGAVASKVRSLDQFEIQSEPESDVNV
ncbi:hypothetical protein CAGGBEG34_210093 [Candidatus Glomeribacter gigasporarum BEG34]|uniref:Uncharacterized protein n=1 Tax=Candidatus Glomeribacter gigasporarum BEG34 TaxID=1070319 RepID=G2J8X8_9BURK|nr:hypothetical protein [Candidatus Glomeribacter gigasporarum]CCD29225.1 hypothetical protein CAGGBEG34_210093 [Candidatus Glomeribacter gigasporarum BEG34]